MGNAIDISKHLENVKLESAKGKKGNPGKKNYVTQKTFDRFKSDRLKIEGELVKENVKLKSAIGELMKNNYCLDVMVNGMVRVLGNKGIMTEEEFKCAVDAEMEEAKKQPLKKKAYNV